MGDMRNVGNWHWVDKNCINWTKEYFKEKLVGMSFEGDDDCRVEISALNSLSGDVDLNQRKGKVITIYDIALVLGWKGNIGESTTASGKVSIPEFMHDTDLSDIVFEVDIDSESKEKEPLKASLKSQLLPLVRQKFGSFQKDLINAHKGDVYIEKAASSSIDSTYKPKPPTPADGVSATQQASVVGGVTNIQLNVEFVASCHDIYVTLLDKDRASIWTRGKAIVEATVGTQFSLFDGNITGEIVELEPSIKIVQKWRARQWPRDHFSTVTMELQDKGDSTSLRLSQSNVPIGEKDSITINWSQYYFNPIKNAFGFGAVGLL